MDWKLFVTTFSTILVAEIGDKTQIAAFAASAQTKSTLTVLLAVVLALAVAGTMGVLVGRAVGEAVPAHILKYVSSALFIGVGIWILFSK